MANKTKPNLNLSHIVNDYESARDTGTMVMLKEETFVELIQYYDAEMQLQSAVEVADFAIGQYQYRAEFYMIKARLLFKNSKFDECLAVLDQIDLVAPEEFEAKILKAKVLAASGKREAAFEIIRNLINTSTANDLLEVHLCESYLHEWMCEYDEMFVKLKQALMISPENTEALERIWIATELSKNYQESIFLHNIIINRNPYNSLAWFNLGHAHASVGEYELAIDSLEYSFIIDENFEIGYVDCAEICFQEKKFDRALGIFEEAHDKFGPDPEILLNIGQCHMKLSDFTSAKKVLANVIKQDPYMDEAHYLIANCHIQHQSWNRALSALNKAMAIDDNREEYYQSLARVFVHLGDFELAKLNYKKAAKVGLEQAIYWEEYISFLIKIGDFESARETIYEAEQFTYSDKIEYCKAAVFFKLDKRKRGLICLDEALTDSASNYGFFVALCPELKDDKEVKAAIKYYLTS